MLDVTADLSCACLRGEVHLVLCVAASGRVNEMEGITVIASDDAAVGIGKGELFIECVSLENVAEPGCDVFVDGHADDWLFVVAHVPYFD